MGELLGLARRTMNWMIVPGVLALYLLITPILDVSNLAIELRRIAAYVVTPPQPENLPISIRRLGEVPVSTRVRSLELSLFRDIEDSDARVELFMTDGSLRPLGWQPKGFQPLFPDRRLQEEFIGKLDAIRVVDREHGESAETIGDLEDAVRIANEFPYSLVPGWRFALITALAAGLSLQLLYFWGILKTLETSSRERSSERAWVFLHEGRLAALLGFLWLTGPSFLLYCAVAQWVEHDRFETWRSPLGVGWCWTVVAGSLFVWNACHELRQEYFSDKGRMQ